MTSTLKESLRPLCETDIEIKVESRDHLGAFNNSGEK